jgi:hypothetical protein
MLLAASDIADVPADLIKHLITLALAFGGAWLAFKRSQQGSKDQPVNIAQPLSVQKHDDAAKRSELLRIETTLKSFGDRVDGLAEQITAQFRAAQQAGEARVTVITQNIDEEIKSLSMRIGNLAEALHEKINGALVDNAGQEQAINDLKANHHIHQRQVEAIQRQINDLIMQGRKRTTS